MLVIRRRAGETLLIGDEVELEILEISASQVKLGIRAPREIAVLRKEIRVTVEQNQAAAVQAPAAALEQLARGYRGPR
jgi:carbon storage regulator